MVERIIDRLVAHVLDTPYEAFGDDVVLGAKRRLIDALGCTVAGVHGAGNNAFVDLFSTWGGTPEAGVPGRDLRLPAPQAAQLASLQARAFDFEVCGPEPEGVNAGKMVGHVASTTEPVALVMAEVTRATGRDLLSAVVLGGDVAARVSVADRFDFNTSFEVCGTSNAFGATAVAGRLLGLDHDQLRNAFGILLHTLSGSFQGIWDGVDSFKLPGALAAYNGILACQLSQRGFAGVEDAVESRRGYFDMYAKNPSAESMLADLGKTFYVHGQHKLHPSCYGNHNPIDVALELRAQHGFAGEDVERVELLVPPNRIDHFLNQTMGPENNQARSLFSIPYGVANALLRGRPELEHYLAPAIHDPAVLDLNERVELIGSLPLGNNHYNQMRVHLRDGRVLEGERSVPLGWLTNPVETDAIVDKFWRTVRFGGTLSESAAQAALDMMLTLEEHDDASELARLLAPTSPLADTTTTH